MGEEVQRTAWTIGYVKQYGMTMNGLWDLYIPEKSLYFTDMWFSNLLHIVHTLVSVNGDTTQRCRRVENWQ